MKIKFILFFLFAIAASSFAQQFPLVTLQDIQFLPDSIIQNGDAPSPLDGDTVRVRGVVLVSPLVDPVNDRRTIISAGARWSCYIQDSSGQVWGGINIIQHDTVDQAQGTLFDLVDTAQVVEFTGVVEEYYTTTQFALLVEPVTPVQVVGQLSERPAPIVLDMTEFMEGGIMKNEAEKYEGMYVELQGVIVSDVNPSSGTFQINDLNGNRMQMYDQSGFFTNRGHNLADIYDYEPPTAGSYLNHIRGVINTRTDDYYIVPLYPGDIEVGFAAPFISNIERSVGVVGYNTPVEVASNIIDPDGQVTQAKLYYRVNGGTINELPMNQDMGDTTLFTATIPGQSDSSLVDYFIWAEDNDGRTNFSPQDTSTSRYFYLALNRDLTIQDVQYSPFGSGYSGYDGYSVTVSGVVTADTSDIPGYGSTALRVYMQNGTGPWSGIWINGIDALDVVRGDNVTVTGEVMENFNVTTIDNISTLVVNSSGNPLPAPEPIATGTIDFNFGGAIEAEQWESVLIKYVNPVITDDNADNSNFGEILVDDGSGETRVELQDGNHSFHNGWDPNITTGTQVEVGAGFDELIGVLYYSFSNFKLVPRKDDDFVNYSSVNDGSMPNEFALSQNYPNPFNPSTTINYSIPEAGYVSLQIYNVLGEVVRTLVDREQSPGEYKVYFNARDLPSGVYFYSIRSGSYAQVKKMMLLK